MWSICDKRLVLKGSKPEDGVYTLIGLIHVSIMESGAGETLTGAGPNLPHAALCTLLQSVQVYKG